jgi:hypothetical protein
LRRRGVVERLEAELLEEQHLLFERVGPEERARPAVCGNVVVSAAIHHLIVYPNVIVLSYVVVGPRDIALEDQGPFIRGKEPYGASGGVIRHIVDAWLEGVVGELEPDERPGLFGRVSRRRRAEEVEYFRRSR